MDEIFKALNDPTRRGILDLLRERDGRTLGEITEALPLSRFGVMKHLLILEVAGLVISRKDGRFKFHYLNPIPLQTALDRWIEPLLAKPMSQLVTALKRNLEGETTVPQPSFVMETFIKTSPAKLWAALTTPEQIQQYYIAGAKPSSAILGQGPYSYDTADGKPLLSGEVLDYSPTARLEMTFEPHWGSGDRAKSRMVYEIEPEGDLCKLTVLHYDLPNAQAGVKTGWARIIGGLKTLLETGHQMASAA
jgi:DNA-binding transcriptional ArsR family regulator/uncharacterized protein YndB with AHSA1/START domain